MSKPSRIIVVVEDARHQMLIYRYLILRRMKPHEFRIDISPSGQGSAESWVRKTFMKEVGEYRRRHTYANSALIIVIDADTGTIQDRIKQLDQALHDNRKEAVQDSEQIARLIPKRNIETWILCLNGQLVDEITDYKNRNHDWNKLIPPAAETLSRLTRPNAQLPLNCIESLLSGIRELNRIRF